MNAKAAVRFFVTRNSLANVLNRSSVSAAVGGGLMATHGGGVATDCLAAMILVGGSGLAAAGRTKAVSTERIRETLLILMLLCFNVEQDVNEILCCSAKITISWLLRRYDLMAFIQVKISIGK